MLRIMQNAPGCYERAASRLTYQFMSERRLYSPRIGHASSNRRCLVDTVTFLDGRRGAFYRDGQC